MSKNIIVGISENIGNYQNIENIDIWNTFEISKNV